MSPGLGREQVAALVAGLDEEEPAAPQHGREGHGLELTEVAVTCLRRKGDDVRIVRAEQSGEVRDDAVEVRLVERHRGAKALDAIGLRGFELVVAREKQKVGAEEAQHRFLELCEERLRDELRRDSSLVCQSHASLFGDAHTGITPVEAVAPHQDADRVVSLALGVLEQERLRLPALQGLDALLGREAGVVAPANEVAARIDVDGSAEHRVAQAAVASARRTEVDDRLAGLAVKR